jgi:signal transduction histidine kinase
MNEDTGQVDEREPAGPALASAVNAVGATADSSAVVTRAASGFGTLFDAAAGCAVHLERSERDGFSLEATSDDSAETTDDVLAAVGTGDEPTWEEDLQSGGRDGDRHRLLVPVRDDGVLVVSLDQRTSAPPDWAVRTLATATLQRVRDLSTADSLREEIRSLEAENEQLTEFASIVAHDLRNPLAVARGRLELAAETGDTEHFEHIQTAHERIESIIEHTLTLAKDTSAMTARPVDLATIGRKAWSTVETDGATLDVASSTQLTADDERLQQLLENLFRNAVEHGTDRDASDVTVAIRTIDQGDETIGFYVEDDGPGIPADERSTVFDRGYTTADDGTGYGLAIVADVVDEHGWSVSVTEGTEGGARFEITDID